MAQAVRHDAARRSTECLSHAIPTRRSGCSAMPSTAIPKTSISTSSSNCWLSWLPTSVPGRTNDDQPQSAGFREAALLGAQRISSPAVPLVARNQDDGLPTAAERALSIGADSRLNSALASINPVRTVRAPVCASRSRGRVRMTLPSRPYSGRDNSNILNEAGHQWRRRRRHQPVRR